MIATRRSAAIVLQRLSLASRGARCLATVPNPMDDPSKFVTGLTKEKVESNPEIAAYLAANFGYGKEEENEEIEFDDEEEGEEGEEGEEEVSEKKEPIRIEQTEEQARRNIRTLICYNRDPVTEEGTRKCEELRLHRMIPGIVYGGDPYLGISSRDRSSEVFVKTQWNLIQRELGRYHNDFLSRVYDLTVFKDADDTEGEVHRVLPRDMQRHPYQDKIYCLNYLRYHPRRPVRIPLHFINEEESAALKAGAFIVPVARYMECTIEDGAPIPEFATVECTDLRVKEVIRIDRVTIPDGVHPTKRVLKKDFVIGTVFGRRSAEVDEEGESAESAE